MHPLLANDLHVLKDRRCLRFECSSFYELNAVNTLPVHDLSAVNDYILRFKYSSTTVPAANVSVRKSAHNTNISKPLGWRIFASHWVVLLLLATEKGPSPASSQGKR